MSRYCPKPECGLIPLDTDTDIYLHILEHQVRIETEMALNFAAQNDELAKLNTNVTAVQAELSNSTEASDQAQIDANTAAIAAANGALTAALPAAPVAPVDPSTVVDPSTGLLPDGTQPVA